MKIFVTGVAGFLGHHLAERLVRDGHEVSGIDNFVGGDSENVPKGVRFTLCDCNDLYRVRELVKGADVVYHLAATAHEGLSVFSPHENAMNGVAASAAIFAAAIHAGVPKVVACSSMARYGAQPPPFTEDMKPHPVDPYGHGKVWMEEALQLLCQVHGGEWVILVPHNIYGTHQQIDPHRNVAAIMINRLLQNERLVIYGDGEQKRCFSHVDDCVEPMVRAMTAREAVGQVINIGPDDEFVSINQLGARISDIMGKPFDPIYLPERPREVKLANCSNAKARRLLGYEPKTSLRSGLERMVEWYRARGPRPFVYRMGLEIENDKVPRTWKERLF